MYPGFYDCENEGGEISISRENIETQAMRIREFILHSEQSGLLNRLLWKNIINAIQFDDPEVRTTFLRIIGLETPTQNETTNDIMEFIRKDDIEGFRTLPIELENLDEDRIRQIIEQIVRHGSVNCFKYLDVQDLLNGHINQEIADLSVTEKFNAEIFIILRDKYHMFDDEKHNIMMSLDALRKRRYDIAEYLLSRCDENTINGISSYKNFLQFVDTHHWAEHLYSLFGIFPITYEEIENVKSNHYYLSNLLSKLLIEFENNDGNGKLKIIRSSDEKYRWFTILPPIHFCTDIMRILVNQRHIYDLLNESVYDHVYELCHTNLCNLCAFYDVINRESQSLSEYTHVNWEVYANEWQKFNNPETYASVNHMNDHMLQTSYILQTLYTFEKNLILDCGEYDSTLYLLYCIYNNDNSISLPHDNSQLFKLFVYSAMNPKYDDLLDERYTYYDTYISFD